MASHTKQPHVLIVGAGLAGLALAQALRKQGITFEIYERDANVHARFQGWAIALHRVLADFNEAMPEDLGSVESTSHFLPLDLHAKFVIHTHGEVRTIAEDVPEHRLIRANRLRLREYLAKNLHINWSKRFTSIVEKDDSVTLHFEDGTSATGDVLVGADGVHSHVRSYLYDGKELLRNLPVDAVVGQVTLNKEQYEKQLEIGRSAYIAFGPDGQRIFVGLNSVDRDARHAQYYWIYIFHSQTAVEGPAYWTQHSKQEQYNLVLKGTEPLEPKLAEIVRITKPEKIVVPGIVLRDLNLESMPNRRVTLVGDSAHAMAPNRGEGGNHAIQDSLNLARAIAKAGSGDILPHLKEYQDEMLVRGNEAVNNSRAAAMDPGVGRVLGWSGLSKPAPSKASAIEAH